MLHYGQPSAAIVKAPLETLSPAIKVINLRYKARCNRTRRRVVLVFGARYRSEAIKGDVSLLRVLCYMHFNKAFVLEPLGGSVRGFTEFHRQSDLTMHLEANEDRESYGWAVSHEVLERFCAMHGVERTTQRTRDSDSRSGKAAEVLETSHAKV